MKDKKKEISKEGFIVAKEEIKEIAKKMFAYVDTIYTVLRHISPSKTYRVISLIVISNDEPVCIDSVVAELLQGYDKRHGGCKVRGVGMDMGANLVSALGMVLYGDSNRFKQKWI